MTTDAKQDVGVELIRARGKLYNFVDGAFTLLKENVQASIVRDRKGERQGYASFSMCVYDDKGKKVTHQEIDNSLLARFYSSELSIVWVVFVNDQRVSLSVKFEDSQSFVKFRNQYSVCLYEVSNPTAFEDLKEEDQKYVMESERDDVVMEETDEEDQDVGENSFLDDPRDGAKVANSPDEHNRHLAVAYNNDRTFVIRGKHMGVFRADDEGMKFNTLVKIKDQKSNAFAPSHVLLHEQDTSMLFLNPEDKEKIYRMDLERGDIVNEFKTPNASVNAMSASSKYANLNPGQDFLGINKNQMMRFDPRDRDFVVQKKQYASGTKTNFTNLATTGAGYVAIGSENGDIRLYNEVGKIAKTHLSGLGDPIVGIDTTEDGSFILATTKTYILVIDTRVKGEVKGGFLKSMGKNKPIPVKLGIKPTDIMKHKMKEISFTPAHFNVGRSLERSIVASTGPFIVTWNFRHVKQGKLETYQIKRYKDNIVADNFAFDDEERIIVTLPDDVTVNRLRGRR
uniref:Vacuolar import/degradation Vid27 C-terminal domain-containing protein n=1 Tax=Rhodosorus marinus TaxID=101924 RepID=A0A7S3EQ34_9RHOD|mmetsp:Transcript_8927/g.39466  ORF Transcript_8927/g.39466 Transcript_8927/m.39466 type:complete len:511 (+) Transcript_8927:282-1814(+)|eukprot:CAMPEP_0113964238 /NCGR_PEP_ID=MMETSP0011_2-20120614/7016_1 /TAXON_ID=101924 /ORGANISM="Rhodosorus marinus" /LENGTH=510 /DNA_ID=CAMNT_0000976493 /DNA_START=184 /DNA_END=1716 /DNA_ORIENTATION=+ /assembly_acc=CAM_ASM_000156